MLRHISVGISWCQYFQALVSSSMLRWSVFPCGRKMWSTFSYAYLTSENLCQMVYSRLWTFFLKYFLTWKAELQRGKDNATTVGVRAKGRPGATDSFQVFLNSGGNPRGDLTCFSTGLLVHFRWRRLVSLPLRALLDRHMRVLQLFSLNRWLLFSLPWQYLWQVPSFKEGYFI